MRPMSEPHGNVVALTRQDGTAQFDCTDCGVTVYRYAPASGSSARCLICQYIAAHELPHDVAERLRGSP